MGDRKLNKEDVCDLSKWIAYNNFKNRKIIYQRILNVKINFQFTSKICPNFQSCISSRNYDIKFKIEFKPQSQPSNKNAFKFKKKLTTIKTIFGSNTNRKITGSTESKMKYNSFSSKRLLSNRYCFDLTVPIDCLFKTKGTLDMCMLLQKTNS